MSTKTINVCICGFSVDVEYDHQPKEAETLTYPGCDEDIDITDVSFKGESIINHISDEFINTLKERIMEEGA
jgi:hypothetical protein